MRIRRRCKHCQRSRRIVSRGLCGTCLKRYKHLYPAQPAGSLPKPDSNRAIAALLKVSDETVRRAKRQQRLLRTEDGWQLLPPLPQPPRPLSQAMEIRNTAIIATYHAGMPIRLLADAYQLSYERVREIVRKGEPVTCVCGLAS